MSDVGLTDRLKGNVWAPDDRLNHTYHRLSIDVPQIVLSVCGRRIENSNRYFVDAAAGFTATPTIGEQCCMCRWITLYGGDKETQS